MSQLEAFLVKPLNPKENFHHLENLTKLTDIPEDAVWSTVKGLLNSPESDKRIIGVYLNAVLTERKTTHLLSGKSISKLLKDQKLIDRKTIDNKHASSIMKMMEEAQLIKTLRPVLVGKKAAVVKVIATSIVDYINAKIGAEVSAQYELSVLNFYDEVSSLPTSIVTSTPEFHTPVPYLSSTTSTNTYITIDSSIESSKEEQLALKCLSSITNLTAFELSFLNSVSEKIAKYKTLTAKQSQLLSDISNKLPKPELTKELAETILKEYTSPEATATAFKVYNYNTRKEAIASMLITNKAIPATAKARIGELLDIQPPKKQEPSFY